MTKSRMKRRRRGSIRLIRKRGITTKEVGNEA